MEEIKLLQKQLTSCFNMNMKPNLWFQVLREVRKWQTLKKSLSEDSFRVVDTGKNCRRTPKYVSISGRLLCVSYYIYIQIYSTVHNSTGKNMFQIEFKFIVSCR